MLYEDGEARAAANLYASTQVAGPVFHRHHGKSGKAPMVPKAEMPQIVASVADEAARLTQAALPATSPLEPSLAESPKPRRMKSNNMQL